MSGQTTVAWHEALREVLHAGSEVSPSSSGSSWKGRTTREILARRSITRMDAPVVFSPARKLGMRFLAAEAAWILSGDNRLSTIAPYSSKIKDFSDDGRRFFGAYGPRFVEQLSHAVRTLDADPSTRQAIINVWREQPWSSKDVPCTLSWQFVQRAGYLHCVATMRSSDLWTGWPYDVFNFSCAAALVLLELRDLYRRKTKDARYGAFFWGAAKLGNLILTAGSSHLYKLDWPGVEEVLEKDKSVTAFDEPYAPLDLDEFESPEAFVKHLWSLANADGTARHRYLRELYA